MKEKIEIIINSRLKYNLPIIQPISTNLINDFQKKFKAFFDFEVPKDFLDFLKISNGLEENGFLVYAGTEFTENNVVKGIFENNSLWYEQDGEDVKYIFFAESGQDLFVLDKKENKCLLIDRYSGEIYESFSNFKNMLLHIFNLMIN